MAEDSKTGKTNGGDPSPERNESGSDQAPAGEATAASSGTARSGTGTGDASGSPTSDDTASSKDTTVSSNDKSSGSKGSNGDEPEIAAREDDTSQEAAGIERAKGSEDEDDAGEQPDPASDGAAAKGSDDEDDAGEPEDPASDGAAAKASDDEDDEDDAGEQPDPASDGAESSAAAKASDDERSPARAPTPAKKGWGSRLWWALPIAMVIEFYAYGHNGRLEICVGKEGHTDFSLVGQERTDHNRWKFPRCETRENLGLRSQYDERVAEGLKVACRGATIFRHQGEAKECVAGNKGWQHRISGHFVPPWDPAYYEHLFWFLK